ncbi:MAG: hypothetical protein JNK05_08680 [Myxococcales bacterium]|nr:hypothetical protein [Myxococcales bacterium]
MFATTEGATQTTDRANDVRTAGRGLRAAVMFRHTHASRWLVLALALPACVVPPVGESADAADANVDDSATVDDRLVPDDGTDVPLVGDAAMDSDPPRDAPIDDAHDRDGAASDATPADASPSDASPSDGSATDAAPDGPASSGRSWIRSYGMGGAHGFRDAALLADGSIIVVGESPVYGSGGDDAIATRIDARGNVLWSRSLGGASSDRLYAVTVADDGDVIAAGRTSSFGPRLWASFVVRFSPDGVVRWQRGIAAASRNYEASSIRSLGGDRYLLTGAALADSQHTAMTTIDGTGRVLSVNAAPISEGFDALRLADGTFIVAGRTPSNTHGSYYGDLVRVRSDGSQQWGIHELQNGSEEGNVFYSIAPAHDGGVVAVGTATLRYGFNRRRVWAISVAEDGTIRWQRTFSGAGASDGYKVIPTSGGYIVFARTSAFGDGARWRGWVLSLDNAGNALWQRTFDNAAGSQWFTSGAVSSRGELVAIGTTYAPSSGGYASGLVLRLFDRADATMPCAVEPLSSAASTTIRLATGSFRATATAFTAVTGTATGGDIPLATRVLCGS